MVAGAGIGVLSFLIPFLQYCFKPWMRKEPNRRLSRVDVAPSSIEKHVVEQQHGTDLPSSNNNDDFKGSTIHELTDDEKQKTTS